MQKESLQDILRRIPPGDETSVVFTLGSGLFLSVDSIVRYEQDYIVMRGREGGTTDEGRAFFVPYNEISFIKIDKISKASELRRMYGETVALDFEERLAAEKSVADSPVPTPLTSKLDAANPGDIAKQNLLARIRAARTSGGGGSSGSTGK